MKLCEPTISHVGIKILQKPNKMFPKRLPWNNLSQNWKCFLSTTTIMGHQSMKSCINKDPNAQSCFMGLILWPYHCFLVLKMQCLTVITISYVWIVLWRCFHIHLRSCWGHGLKSSIPWSIVYSCVLEQGFPIFSLFLSFSILKMGINKHLPHTVNERVKSIKCKGLKIGLMHDKS